MPSLTLAKWLLKAWREKGLPWILEMIRLMLSSPRHDLDSRFASPQLRTMLAAWAMHLDFAPDSAGGAVFPYLEAMSCQNFGMKIGQGGADTVIKAITSALTTLGGELMLGVEATSVEVEGGKASVVSLSDGRKLKARKAVIAGVHPRNLVDRLVPCIAPNFAKSARKFRPGPATMMLHLVLDSLPEWRAGPELQQFAYVHIADNYDAMTAAYQQPLGGLLPTAPVLVVGQPTAVDPSRAPAGKHVLWVQIRAVPYAIHGDAAGTIETCDWAQVAAPFAERIIDQLEQYAPGLQSKILGSKVLTPLDLKRINPNLVGGDSLAGSHHLDQNFLFRPFPGWSRWRTPIRNLYMVGASTWPGAGTGAGSGYMLAKQLAG
ncbi:NAD(P)/FAD-dependent oxidoreductase [Novosphingobium humi]|uniref:phytoene desaturase family protein n=1 Tax=Novosphingobium humi TaxID=2282397 RepID=UPI0030811019